MQAKIRSWLTGVCLTAMVFGMLAFTTQEAQAGCKLRVKLKNSHNTQLNVGRVYVLFKGGSAAWLLINTVTRKMDPGKSASFTFNTIPDCKRLKKFKIKYKWPNLKSNSDRNYTTKSWKKGKSFKFECTGRNEWTFTPKNDQ